MKFTAILDEIDLKSTYKNWPFFKKYRFYAVFSPFRGPISSRTVAKSLKLHTFIIQFIPYVIFTAILDENDP